MELQRKPLYKQTAIVTGASGGIGRAIAVNLADCGADVWLVGRRREALEEVAGKICSNGTQPHVCCADLTEDADLVSLTETIEHGPGKLDVLVHCAGVIKHGPLERTPVADFDLQYRSNLRAQYALTQLMLPSLRKARGQIVFINSSAGLRSPANTGQFSATQHALRALADTLRDEVNSDGIRVLSVYPGRTATPRIETLFAKEGRRYQPELLLQPEDVAAMVAHTLSLPRTAEVTDICIRPMCKSY